MSDNDVFYHVYTASDAPCHLTRQAAAEARRTWLCPGCLSPKPGVAAVDAQLRLAPTKEPLNFVFGAGLPIVSRAFLDALGDGLVQRDLYVGRVYGPDGQELTGWATFRGKRQLIIRGSKNVQHRRCAECGQNLYFSMGKKYLYPAPPSGVALFESDLWGLVLAGTAFARAGVENWSGMYIDKLMVENFPKDSLGELAYP